MKVTFFSRPNPFACFCDELSSTCQVQVPVSATCGATAGGGGQRPAGHRPAQRRPDPVEPALAGLHTIELIFDTVVTLN